MNICSSKSNRLSKYVAVCVIGIGAISSGAFAVASYTSACPFTITGTIKDQCTLSIASQPVDLSANNQTMVTMTGYVRCKNTPPGAQVKITADNGLNSLAGSRRLKQGTDYITYGLYTDSTGVTPWTTDLVAGSISISPTVNASTPFSFYFKAGEDISSKPTGNYVDTVTVTLNVSS